MKQKKSRPGSGINILLLLFYIYQSFETMLGFKILKLVWIREVEWVRPFYPLVNKKINVSNTLVKD